MIDGLLKKKWKASTEGVVTGGQVLDLLAVIPDEERSLLALHAESRSSRRFDVAWNQLRRRSLVEYQGRVKGWARTKEGDAVAMEWAKRQGTHASVDPLSATKLVADVDLPDEVNAVDVNIYQDVAVEVGAQINAWGVQEHEDGTGSMLDLVELDAARRDCKRAELGKDPLTWKCILHEEVREAFSEEDLVRLREELVQVAAVCVSWIRDIDTRGEGK